MNDSRISVIHKPNGGVSSARNLGITKSKGDFITFIDGDDILINPDLYRQVMIYFYEDQMLDIVQFDTIFKFNTSEAHRRQFPFRKYDTKKDIYEAYLKEHIHVACWDKIYKRNIFNGISFPVGQTAEDIAIIPQIIGNTRSLRTVSVGYYGYSYSPSSTSNTQTSLEKIVSILQSYHSYCSGATRYRDIRGLAAEVYIGQFWMYLSYIRVTYPKSVYVFLKQVEVIRIPIIEIAKSRLSAKRKLQLSIINLFGKSGALLFQKLLTHNFR